MERCQAAFFHQAASSALFVTVQALLFIGWSWITEDCCSTVLLLLISVMLLPVGGPSNEQRGVGGPH